VTGCDESLTSAIALENSPVILPVVADVMAEPKPSEPLPESATTLEFAIALGELSLSVPCTMLVVPV
jgi:hypothetical protein